MCVSFTITLSLLTYYPLHISCPLCCYIFLRRFLYFSPFFMFFFSRGVAYSVKAYQIPLGSRVAKGVPLPQVLPISSEEQV